MAPLLQCSPSFNGKIQKLHMSILDILVLILNRLMELTFTYMKGNAMSSILDTLKEIKQAPIVFPQRKWFFLRKQVGIAAFDNSYQGHC